MSKLTLRDAYVESLEAENDVLRGRIMLLEHEIGLRNDVPLLFGLTGSEARIMSMLVQRGMVTKEQLLIAACNDATGNEMPEIKIVDVYICKMRKKLLPFGIVIETVWGRGYNLTAENRALVNGYHNGPRVGVADETVHKPAPADGRISSVAVA